MSETMGIETCFCDLYGQISLNIKPVLYAKHVRDFAALSKVISDKEQEYVLVFAVRDDRTVTSGTVVAIGHRDVTTFPVASLFKAAIASGAAGIVVVHNHPSGSLKISKLDKKSLKVWQKAGKLLDIPVIAALIVAKKRWAAYSEPGKRGRL